MLQRLSVIFATLALTSAQINRPPLQVDITKSVECRESEKAGEGDKVWYK